MNRAGAKPNSDMPDVYLLGRKYNAIHEHDKRKQYETSLFWFTYRCDFPSIEPYKITTDAGFGCMLRSAQMMLAQALRMHFRSRHWRPPRQVQKCRDDPFMAKLFTWFADYPGKECIYSVHNMIATGLQYEILPGEWYGPGSACCVVRDLVQMHSKQNELKDLFRVHVASESTVYKDTVYEVMTTQSGQRAKQRESVNSTLDPLAQHPLDPCLPDPMEETKKLRQLEWDTGLLLLIPLRLGLDQFNERYSELLARTFSFPQSVGVLGGRPRGARWFYGAHSDGSNVLGLDPHTVQTAPQRRTIRAGKLSKTSVSVSEDYVHSIFTTCPETYPISKMDPSLALAFYCSDRKDFLHLEELFRDLKQTDPEQLELFTFSDSKPDYSSGALNSMMQGGGAGIADFDDDDGIDGFDEESDAVSDESDYVLL